MHFFFQNRFHVFIVHASFFHFTSCLFAEIAFFAVQITKGKLKFRKTENMQLWYFVSSVTEINEIIVRPLEMGFFVSFRHRTK